MKDKYVFQAQTTYNVQATPLIKNYFSDRNIDIIQLSLIKNVKKNTGLTISKQSCNEVFTIMSYVYSNFGHNMVSQIKVVEETERLNMRVLNELVPMVSSNALQYVQYIKDISTLPTPIDHGQSTSNKGNYSLEYKDPF
jgi:hypothetical protein